MALSDFRYTRRAAAVKGIADIEQQMVELETWLRRLKASIGTPTPGLPAGGTTGQVVTKDTATDYDVSWQTPKTVATDVLWDAKGDLAVGTGADAAARLAVGTNGQILMADSTVSPQGVKWAPLTPYRVSSAPSVTATFRMAAGPFAGSWTDNLNSPSGTVDLWFTDEWLEISGDHSQQLSSGSIVKSGGGAVTSSDLLALDLTAFSAVDGRTPQDGLQLSGLGYRMQAVGVLQRGVFPGPTYTAYALYATYSPTIKAILFYFLDGTTLRPVLGAPTPFGSNDLVYLQFTIRLPKHPNASGYTGAMTIVSGSNARGTYYGKSGV